MSWLLPCGDWVYLGTYKGVDVSWGDIAQDTHRIPDQLVVQWIKDWFDKYVRDEMLEHYSHIDEYVIFMAWIRFGIREMIHKWDHVAWSTKIENMLEVNK